MHCNRKSKMSFCISKRTRTAYFRTRVLPAGNLRAQSTHPTISQRDSEILTEKLAEKRRKKGAKRSRNGAQPVRSLLLTGQESASNRLQAGFQPVSRRVSYGHPPAGYAFRLHKNRINEPVPAYSYNIPTPQEAILGIPGKREVSKKDGKRAQRHENRHTACKTTKGM